MDRISPTFLQYATDILADTVSGLSGPQIIKVMIGYAVEYGINLPHNSYPFGAPNKRSALYDNLLAFQPEQQYRIIKELCDHGSLGAQSRQQRRALKIRLMNEYHELDTATSAPALNEGLVEETKHWLSAYPEALKLYDEALVH